MVMYIPQRGEPRYYPASQIGQSEPVGVKMPTYLLPVTAAELEYLEQLLHNDQKHPELEAKVVEWNAKIEHTTQA